MDTTGRGLDKAEEEELRRARLLLERAEEMAKIGSWEFDYVTRTVTGSPGARRIYGVEGDLTVEGIEVIPLPEYRPLLNKARDEHVRFGKPYDIEFKVQRVSDGAILDIHSRAAWDGQHKKLFGILMDITEEKKIQAEIVELNRNLERRVTERTAELKAANEALSKALADLSASQERQIVAEKMATLGRLVASLAHELNTPLGAIISASEMEMKDIARFLDDLLSVRRFSDHEFEAFVKIARNVLERTPEPDHAEERARKKAFADRLGSLGIADGRVLAEELVDSGFSSSVGELGAMAETGDFSAVVNAAQGLGSVIMSNLIVREAAEKAAHVLSTLKTYAYQGVTEELGKADPRLQLETILALYHNRVAAGIGIERRFADIPAVPCYPDRLAQVWTNLLSNAIQAMGTRGHLLIEVRAGADEAEGRVLVSITDDGPGIAAENREKVFKPFFTTKASGEGSGLGLDICRRLLEQIGATITFESRPGRTTFTVCLRTRLEA